MITFSVIFNRKKKKLSKNDLALVQIRAYQNKKNRYFSTGIKVRKSQFHTKSSRIINHENADVLNDKIQEMISRMQRACVEKPNITLQTLVGEDTGKDQSFHEFAQRYLKLKKFDLTANTMRSHQIALASFKSFMPNISISGIDLSLIERYDAFMKKEGNKASTRKVYHSKLQLYLKKAIALDIISQNPYDRFTSSKIQKSPPTFLTMEEIDKIQDLKILENWIGRHKSRDMFLFRCYTGLRHGDAIQLSSDNFIETDKGLVLEFKAQKTKKPHKLPLYLLFDGKPETIARRWLEKFAPKSKFWKSSIAAECTRLKYIFEKAGVDKNASTHVARHTFATSLVTRIPLAILQKLLQHSDISTTMIYVSVNDDMIEKELGKVEW